MDRVFESGAAAAPPSQPVSPSTGYPTAGNPQTAVPATKPGPWWYHMVTEELRAVIAAAGITPSHTDVSQLSTAIRRLIDGGDYKASVRVATTTNITLSGEQTIDGVAVVAGDRVLVMAQTAGAENGIYVAATGAWARAEDANGAGDLTSGVLVPVESGTANADTVWMLTTDGAITIGTTALTWQIKSMTKGVQRFTSNGSFTVPAGVSTIYVSGCAGGGGGGGGGGTSTTSGSGCGGSGGAGQPIILQPYTVTPGQIISISIGGAGSLGAGGGAGISGGNGTAGGNTVIGSLTTLTGGAGGGGGQGSTGAQGAGGSGGGGYPTGAYGGDGGAGGAGGAGASGPYGGGGGAGRSGSASGIAASSAFGFGAGGAGGGGVWQSAGAGAAGSAGAPGLVIIEW